MTAQRHERVPAWTRGDRLRKARLLTGLTARDFADKIGVSHGTVSNAEGDKHDVRKIVLNAWAMATGVPVEWLETGVASPSPTPPEGPKDSTDSTEKLARLTRSKRGQELRETTRRYLAPAVRAA
jgi:transcriptional regulator with XRE-family HTH domain